MTEDIGNDKETVKQHLRKLNKRYLGLCNRWLPHSFSLNNENRADYIYAAMLPYWTCLMRVAFSIFTSQLMNVGCIGDMIGLITTAPGSVSVTNLQRLFDKRR